MFWLSSAGAWEDGERAEEGEGRWMGWPGEKGGIRICHLGQILVWLALQELLGTAAAISLVQILLTPWGCIWGKRRT